MTRMLVRIALLLLICLGLAPTTPLPRFIPAALAEVAGAMPAAITAGTALREGALPGDQPLRLAIGLAPDNPAGMQEALAALYNPSSSSYHRFLTPGQVQARFGPDPARVASLAAWLSTQRLTALPWDGGLLLDVRGTAHAIGAAFHTHLSLYRYPVARAMAASPGRADLVDTGYGPDTRPLLPSRFATLVTAIAGLSGIAPAHAAAHLSLQAVPRHAAGATIGYAPAQVTSAYDFRPLYTAGLHGERLRVALVELAPYDPTDVETYFTQFGPGATISSHEVDGGNLQESSNVEATLDIELLGPSAPGAAIDVYNAPNDASGAGLLDAYSAVASAGNADVLMLTWVHCEPEALQIDGFVQVQHTLFQTLALQGTTIVAASGDAGAYGCSDGEVAANDASVDVSKPVVSLPASDPYVLGVAASDATLSTSQDPTLLSESAWSCPAKTYLDCAQFGYKGGASGGGLSSIFHTGDAFGDDLSWQTGPGVRNTASDGYRQVPDVAISGSYGVDPDHDDIVYWQGVWRVGGGTSAAAPYWSALVLLADQYLLQHGGQPLGWINPVLYRLAGSHNPNAPLHDIVTGSNLLYSATVGWDYASGWGSPDAWSLVRDLGAMLLGAPASPTGSPVPTGTVLFTSTSTLAPTFAPTATVPLSATAGTPAASATPQHGSPTPTATPGLSATPALTVLPTSSATVYRSPTPTPTPSPDPLQLATPANTTVCPRMGIGNGAFTHGTLACWQIGGAIPPRIVTTVPAPHRYSVQLGDRTARQAALSQLSQTFLLPPNAHGSALHINYWVEVTNRAHVQGASGCGIPCATTPAYPRLTVIGPNALPVARANLQPRRTGVWSGLRLPLVTCAARTRCPAERLKLSLIVPPQPPGISMVLYVDDIHLGA